MYTDEVLEARPSRRERVHIEVIAAAADTSVVLNLASLPIADPRRLLWGRNLPLALCRQLVVNLLAWRRSDSACT